MLLSFRSKNYSMGLEIGMVTGSSPGDSNWDEGPFCSPSGKRVECVPLWKGVGMSTWGAFSAGVLHLNSNF